jgi:hypothetical protein
VEKTGNPRAAQQQLGHKNLSATMQHLPFIQTELQGGHLMTCADLQKKKERSIQNAV